MAWYKARFRSKELRRGEESQESLLEIGKKFLIELGMPKVDCFVKTRKFDLIDIIAEALKFVVSLSN